MIDLIAFDADDTLWGNENYFYQTQNEYAQILSDYGCKEAVLERLHSTEIKNLKLYGYGVKSYTLSMIEAALSLSFREVPGELVAKILALGAKMLTEPVQPMIHVQHVLEQLSQDHDLITITKGDLLDQNRKMKKSGLANYFSDVIVVSEKDDAAYQQIIDSRQIKAANFLMVGNSMKSDIVPVLNIGGYGVHVPYEFTWEHEKLAEPVQHDKLFEINSMNEILDLKFFN
ncbi:HAD family hydrolase [Ancylomarina euxinus]|uniref:HAD family hydrolase n=1 Tax=Ancylomarina euxinus TaxID=2283627 RepID=A0A425Y1P3_9BACT|nr:HAD family hydrolase [Ancylomarina euxinus]MCZ4695089.1 HAD family hydrolase [Ancylomarina euxinus]MUP14975.1 HAD hydrolase-like protein [Ancylomarina euxinus]RRG21865.1 HAD family hydrolase [Ancylomarina euxinus]